MPPVDQQPRRGKVRKKQTAPSRGPQGLPGRQGSAKKVVRKPNKLTARPVSGSVNAGSGSTAKANVVHTPKVGTAATRERASHALTPRQQTEVDRRARARKGSGIRLVRRVRKDILDSIDPKKVYAVGTGAGPSVLVPGRKTHFATVMPRQVKSRTFGKVGKNLIRDAIDFVPGTVSSTYHLADTTVNHGPIEAGKQLAEGAYETVKHPADHPLYAAMIVRGSLKGADNTAGRVMRTVPGPTRKLASRKRAPRPVEGTGRAIPSEYAKGPVTKAAQVARERSRVKKGKTPQPAVKPKEVKRLATEDVRAEEVITRANQGDTAKRARDAIAPRKKLRRKKPTAATNLAAQGIVDTSRADLEAYLHEIKVRHGSLPADKAKRNEATQRLIEKALRSHDPVEVRRAATAVNEVLHDLDRQVVAEGVVSAAEAEKTRLAGPAVRRHRANEETARSAKVEARQTKKALRSTTGKARRDLQSATVELERARGAAKVSVATRKQTPALREAVRVRDRAVRQLAVVRRQATAHAAQSRAVKKHSNPTQVAAAAAKRAEFKTRVTAAREDVRVADAKVRTEQARIEGVGPREADRLRNALAARGEAVAGRTDALANEKAARAERVKLGKAGYVSDTGKPLLNEDIRAAMPTDAIEPAYVSHQDTSVRSPALPVDRPSLPTKTHRTGDNIHTGGIDAHPAKLVEQAIGSQRIIDSARARKRFIDGWAYRAESEAPKTFSGQDIAKRWASDQDLKGKTGHEWEAITRQDGQAVLVPKDAVGRLRDHLAESTQQRNNAFSVFSNQWRRNVLMWNPRWYVGNTFEASLRSLVANAGPLSYYTGQQVRKRLSPEDRLMLDARTRSGGHYESASHIISDRTIQRNADDLAHFAKALDKFRKAPGVHHTVDFYNGMTKIAFESFNGRIESQFQTAMLGRALRDHPLMEGSTLKLSSKAFEEAARGLRNTDAMAQLGRKVDDMYGQYGKFSPKMQHLIANYTPFIAWTLNATNFLYRVLPRDHPVLSGVIASANAASEDWRKDHRQFLDFWGQVDGQDPPWLQASIPGKNGSHLRIGRYTPFGLLSSDGGTPFSGLAGLILPQVAEIGENLQGKDFMHADLSSNPNGARATLATAASFLESMIPAASQVTAVAGIKLPNERDKHTPKDSQALRLRKKVDPFMYTQSARPRVRKKSTRSPKKSSSSGDFDFSGVNGGGSSGDFDFSDAGGSSSGDFDFSGAGG